VSMITYRVDVYRRRPIGASLLSGRNTDGLAGWPVTVGVVEMGVVSQPGADAKRYRCAFTLDTGAGWAW